jgi:hypothetical protein
MLAFFTFALWRATDKLWQSAENQLAEFRRSLKYSEAVAAQQTLDTRASIAEASRAADTIAEQRDLMRVQQEVMASQRDISAATQRAWVRVDVKIAGPIRISEEDITACLGVELTNFGALPAYAEGPMILAYPLDLRVNSEVDVIDRLNIYRAQDMTTHTVVFPQQTVVFTLL